MHRDLIRHLDDSVAEVFAYMLNLPCTAELIGLAIPCCLPPSTGLTAFVQFAGALEGVFTLQVTQCTAAELAANLTGMAYADVPFELCADTAGELCNMIAGSWKARQSAKRAACQLSCPTILIGVLTPPSTNFLQSVALLYYFAGHRLILHLTCN